MLRADLLGGGGGGAGGGVLLLLQDTWIIVALYFLSKYKNLYFGPIRAEHFLYYNNSRI